MKRVLTVISVLISLLCSAAVYAECVDTDQSIMSFVDPSQCRLEARKDFKKGDYKSAWKKFEIAYKQFRIIPPGIEMGRLYQRADMHHEAIKAYQKALKIDEVMTQQMYDLLVPRRVRHQCYVQIGLSYFELKDRALDYFTNGVYFIKTAIKYAPKIKEDSSSFTAPALYLILAGEYLKKAAFEKENYYLDKALEICKQYDFEIPGVDYCNMYERKAWMYYRAKKDKEALEYYNRARGLTDSKLIQLRIDRQISIIERRVNSNE